MVASANSVSLAHLAILAQKPPISNQWIAVLVGRSSYLLHVLQYIILTYPITTVVPPSTPPTESICKDLTTVFGIRYTHMYLS